MNGELNKQNVERFLTYDRNGNLLTLIRYADGVQSSNRQYTYIGNRLDRMEKDKVIAWDEIEVHPGGPAIVVPEKVTEDNGTTALDAEISIDTSAVIRPVDPGIILHSRYAHDRNGNLTYDMELETNFAYNSLNLLEKAVRNDTIVAKYSYLADGTKLSAVNADDCGFAYRGSFTYRADAGGDRVFESTPFGGGRIVGTVDDETEVRYFLTDHLESVRVVATDQNNVLERNDYYPFGKRWDTASLPVSDNRDRFNGKEDQVFIGDCLADYGARCYNKLNGRWLAQDPKAENFINSSHYCFCGNNPINRIDFNGEDWYEDEDGNVIWRDSRDKEYIDENDVLWKNVGESRVETVGNITISFSQQENEDGSLSLYTFGTIEKNGIIRMYDPETGNVGSIVGEKGIKNDNSLFDLLFLGKGASNIFNLIFETTVHGATRVAGVSATRGGVLSKFEVIVARIGGTRMTQADGAFVYIYQKASGKFNVAVFGRNGFVTSFRNISQKSLDRLSKNYGWH